MLCDLAARRNLLGRSGGYTLRVTGKTALGSSGTGGRDGKEYESVESLVRDLESLGVNQEVRAAAIRVLSSGQPTDKFISIAEQVQIAFDVLERADLYLFDE